MQMGMHKSLICSQVAMLEGSGSHECDVQGHV